MRGFRGLQLVVRLGASDFRSQAASFPRVTQKTGCFLFFGRSPESHGLHGFTRRRINAKWKMAVSSGAHPPSLESFGGAGGVTRPTPPAGTLAVPGCRWSHRGRTAGSCVVSAGCEKNDSGRQLMFCKLRGFRGLQIGLIRFPSANGVVSAGCAKRGVFFVSHGFGDDANRRI